MRGVAGWGRRTGLQVLGWVLLLVGVAALVLPGPGLLMMFAGMAVLAQENEWAERRLEPVKRRAFDAAAESVKTWPRIVASCLSAAAVGVVGIVWAVQPPPPGWWPVADTWWLFGGLGTAISMLVSCVLAFALIVYSVRNFRGPGAGSVTTPDVADAPDEPGTDEPADADQPSDRPADAAAGPRGAAPGRPRP